MDLILKFEISVTFYKNNKILKNKIRIKKGTFEISATFFSDSDFLKKLESQRLFTVTF